MNDLQIPLDLNYFNKNVSLKKRMKLATILKENFSEWILVELPTELLTPLLNEPKTILWDCHGSEWVTELQYTADGRKEVSRPIEVISRECIEEVTKTNDIRIAEPITLNQTLFYTTSEPIIIINLEVNALIDCMLGLRNELKIPLNRMCSSWLELTDLKLQRSIVHHALEVESNYDVFDGTIVELIKAISLDNTIPNVTELLSRGELIYIEKASKSAQDSRLIAALYFQMLPQIANARDPVAWAIAEFIVLHEKLPSRSEVSVLLVKLNNLLPKEKAVRTARNGKYDISDISEEKKRVFKVLISSLIVGALNDSH